MEHLAPCFVLPFRFLEERFFCFFYIHFGYEEF